MAITCGLYKERYVLGSDDTVVLLLHVSSNYNTTKKVSVKMVLCEDADCSRYAPLTTFEPEVVDLPANSSEIYYLTITNVSESPIDLLNKLLAICVYNVTDNKYECCDTFVIVTQFDEMINATMSMIPMMLMFVVVGMVIGFIPKITESFKR